MGYRRNTFSDKESETLGGTQLKGRVAGVHSSCNLGKAWIELIQLNLLLVEKPLCLLEQPWKVSKLQRRSLLCSHPAWQEELKGSSLKLTLACSQIACNGKGVQESSCTHSFLCSLITESWKKHIQMLFTWSGIMLFGSVCSLCVSWSSWPGYSSGLYLIWSLYWATAGLVKGAECIHHTYGGLMLPFKAHQSSWSNSHSVVWKRITKSCLCKKGISIRNLKGWNCCDSTSVFLIQQNKINQMWSKELFFSTKLYWIVN